MKANNWDLDKEENKQKRRVRIMRLTISTFLGLVGLTIIASQIIPLTGSIIQGRLMENSARPLANPLPEEYKQYIQGEFAYYDPGQSYFQSLAVEASEYTTYLDNLPDLPEPIIDKTYGKNMSLSIESAGIQNVNVTPNVESSDENVYNQYLTRGLAHFKGTPLPGDHGNSFIYGHSAVTSFFNSHPDLPETIFTRLEKVDIGDIIEIEKDNETLTYTVRNKRIVEPDDFSILQHNSRRETITLMTCWPVGIGSKRLVVTGELNEL